MESSSDDIDDDPTAELEALTDVELELANTPKESDEHTLSFEISDGARDVSESRLREDLRARDISINKLQFDIEQLRSRWNGLEQEIKVREQLTDEQNVELRKLRQLLLERDQLIKQQSAEIDSLDESLRTDDELLQESQDGYAAATAATESALARIQLLELHQSSDATTIAMQDKELQKIRADVKRYKELAAAPAQEILNLKNALQERQTELDDLRLYVDGRKSDWQAQELELRDKDQALEQQARRVRDLGIKLDSTEEALATAIESAAQVSTPEIEIPEPVMVVAYTGAAEFHELQTQLLRTESYADSLRQHLQDARNDAEFIHTSHDRLQEETGEAVRQANDLAAQLDVERLSRTELERKHAELQRSLDAEIARLQSELAKASKQADEQRTSNERLSTLLEERDRARDLQENAIAELQRQSDEKHDGLQRRLDGYIRQMAELQENLVARDSTVEALRAELSSKSGSDSSIDEIGHAIHDLDDRMQATIKDRSTSDRDRCTRLLVGKLDGQELRFPLFKDRLTIGRSGMNDIQIKMQSVSRSHAFITCDSTTCHLSDNNSKNGTWLNDVRVTEADLTNGDKIGIGTATLVYEVRSRR